MSTGADRMPAEQAKRVQELSRELDEWLGEEPLEVDPEPLWPVLSGDPWTVDLPEITKLDEFDRAPNGNTQQSAKTAQRTSRAAPPPETHGQGGSATPGQPES